MVVMRRNRVFREHGDWSLGTDEEQWILGRRHAEGFGGWDYMSCVRSTRDILERCMREKGLEGVQIDYFLEGLPDSFEEWKRAQPVFAGRVELF